MRQLETLTRVMTRRNIRIKFSGAVASTDGKTITLPSFGAGAELTDKQLQLIRGYCDHETAHIQSSNFEQWRSTDSRVRRLVNIIEDIRIEVVIPYQFRSVSIQSRRKHDHGISEKS